MDNLLPLIPALPLAAAIVTALLGKRILREWSYLPALAALLGSLVLSVVLLTRVHSQAVGPSGRESDSTAQLGESSVGFESIVTLWRWADVDSGIPAPGTAETGAVEGISNNRFTIDVTLRADSLTAVMLTMVTLIASLIVVFAKGYMHGDPGFWRFFSYLALFVFSMCMLVLVSNFLLLYVFWEAVGVCSYLLIGFWYHKPSAAAASKKAFLVNRVGDFGFALGVFLIWTTYGTLNFHDIPSAEAGHQVIQGVLGQSRLADPQGYATGGVALAICLLLFVGACGKSAQFPLHVWLPDAMEGPTPVSALIHAATMVTAGVYMVARCTPLFIASPRAQAMVALTGGFTALLAAVIAITQTDLKRVLAYSTVSQLGYMFLALGTGSSVGIIAGLFHLFTHAFFKALLFLCSGSVMHAMGNVIDMRRFSGLRRIMPVTYRCFLVGCLALGGVFPLAGFWSKDAILAAVLQRGGDDLSVASALGLSRGSLLDEFPLYRVLYYSALFTAFLTAMYSFRALFLTFFGPCRIPREAGDHAHESPASMSVPLVVLACCSVAVGYYLHAGDRLADFLSLTPSLSYAASHAALPHGHGVDHFSVAVQGTLAALLGIGVAAFLYLGGRKEVESLRQMWESAYGLYLARLSQGKFFIDQIYEVLFVYPLRGLARVLDGVDRHLIDGFANFLGRIPGAVGSLLRPLQSGMIQFYALAMVLGWLVLIGSLLFWPGR